MLSKSNRKRDEHGMLLQDREVLTLLLAAKTRSQICEELDMPLGTLNNICTRIYKQTGCKSLPELLLKYAIQKDLEVM